MVLCINAQIAALEGIRRWVLGISLSGIPTIEGLGIWPVGEQPFGVNGKTIYNTF